MSNCTRLTDSTFADEVLAGSGPVLVEFWGSWCPPCKMMEPVLEALAERLAGRVKVCKLNIDQYPAFRNTYHIMGVPTFVMFDGGKPARRAIGAHSLQQLLGLIDAARSERTAGRPIVEVPPAASGEVGRAAIVNETHS
jgi:thioredoxin 1